MIFSTARQSYVQFIGYDLLTVIAAIIASRRNKLENAHNKPPSPAIFVVEQLIELASWFMKFHLSLAATYR